MKSSSFSSKNILISSALLMLFLVPSIGHAAAKAPSCVLFVSTPDAFVAVHDEESVEVEKGDTVVVSWIGSNARNAVQNKKHLPLIGVSAMTVQGTESQSFVFTGDTGSATCTVTFRVLDIEVDKESLTSSRSTPTITGHVSDVDTLSLEVWNSANTKKLYTRNSIRVKKDEWKAKISKKLEDGTYTLRIFTGKRNDRELLTTETLQIGDAPVREAQLVAESVPLLSGGFLKANSSVPVSYLHIVNTGKESAHITGFTLTQHGSARTEAVSALTLHDRGKNVGSSASQSTLFNKEKEVSIDTDISIAPGESRVLTIKTQASADMRPFLGTELKLDVTSIETDASLHTKFPIRGTTWKPSL